MLDYIRNFEWNGTMGILLYWVPLALCVFGYTVRTAKNYMKDRAEREKAGGYYIPTDRVGTLIGRGLVSVIPVANLWAGMFDISPKLFSGVIDWLDMVFNVPLVPDSEAAKAKRQANAPR